MKLWVKLSSVMVVTAVAVPYLNSALVDYNPPIKPLDDPKAVIEVISMVSGTPEAIVAQTLLSETRNLGSTIHNAMKQQHIPFHVPSTELDTFYANNNGFIYETTAASTVKGRHDQRLFIAERLKTFCGTGPLKIFVHGDGLGFDSAYLASLGHTVFYYEPGEKGQEYARQVFQRNSVQVTMLESMDDIQPHSMDVIITMDVLEHIPSVALDSVIASFHKWLKRGGWLFASTAFWMVSPIHPTHLKENLIYVGDLSLYKNFHPVDSNSQFWVPLVLQKNDADTANYVSPTLPAMLKIYRGIVAQKIIAIPGLRYVLTKILFTIAGRPPMYWTAALEEIVANGNNP